VKPLSARPRNPLIPHHLPTHVTAIPPAHGNYQCCLPMEGDNEERHYVLAVPTEVGLCLC